ncbi:MAG: 23S rRNA (guanosine(2251)-2'-O)-methyltransferase RlmB [Nitrospira sp.]|nr:23S rRNA (guanosine(2251)-2'-O)-methyltransferase RlmB [Nitrospira sp.]
MFGIRAVTEALRSGSRTFIKILLSHRHRQFSPIIRFAKVQGVPLQVQPRERLDRLVSSAHHQGVVALVAAKSYASEDEILGHAGQQDEPGFFLALDGVEDPQNFGAVLRTAATAGIHGVFIPDRRSVGLTASVAKSSAGAVEHVRVARCPNIGTLIKRLQDRGMKTVALDPRSPRLYTELDFKGPTLLVFGGEGRGLRSRIVDQCDAQARIPMRGQVNSLNVSASVAVVAYEVVRQRGV